MMKPKYESLWDGPKTVAEFIDMLSQFPPDWPVTVSTRAGGGIGIEHRESNGKPFVGIFGKNGTWLGENPLTEEEYQKQSKNFLDDLNLHGYHYTSIHGDHRTYSPRLGDQATCYGKHYDRRVIERMVQDGLISANIVDLERLARLAGDS